MVRKTDGGIDLIKEKINKLIGEKVNMEISRGRKKTQYFSGVVESVYPQVFIVSVTNGLDGLARFSCSYSDVLCGNVVVNETSLKEA